MNIISSPSADTNLSVTVTIKGYKRTVYRLHVLKLS